MEVPHATGNGNIPQRRKYLCCRVVLYTLIFVLIVISFLAFAVFCLLQHKKPPQRCWAHGSSYNSSSDNKAIMSWNWTAEHCDGLVQYDRVHLIIKESGTYHVYGQVNREEDMKESFTVKLCKEPNIILNEVVGPKMGDKKGTVNFARPFQLQKGDKLYCEVNFGLKSVAHGNETYWGLFKI